MGRTEMELDYEDEHDGHTHTEEQTSEREELGERPLSKMGMYCSMKTCASVYYVGGGLSHVGSHAQNIKGWL